MQVSNNVFICYHGTTRLVIIAATATSARAKAHSTIARRIPLTDISVSDANNITILPSAGSLP